MPYKKKEIEKSYYSIGEVAEMFKVTTSLIRFWDKQFTILKPRKNKKGNRMFTPKDIENLKRIHYLVKEKGFTLKGAMLALKRKEDLELKQEDSLFSASETTTASETTSTNEPTAPSETSSIAPIVETIREVKQIESSVPKKELLEKLVRIRQGLLEVKNQMV
jgi:DNA-binding transcriptional MerR regulator